MSTINIIATQFKHIKNNLKDYIKILFPVLIISLSPIFIIVFYLQEIPSEQYMSSNYLLPVVITYILIILLFYTKLSVNIHRLIILKDTSNYFFGFNKNKITIIYFFYCILYIVSSMLAGSLLKVSKPLIKKVIPTFLIENIQDHALYSVLALNFPQISIGKKINFFKMVKLSTGARKTLFIQSIFSVILSIVLPLTIVILHFEFEAFISFFDTIAIIIILFSFIQLFINGMLAHTYLLWKKQKDEEKTIED